ncbi:MAG: 3-deoxy-7-phosphoheptulonate synthase [Dehalococcoidia bacterium]|nr:3-deoxy-7-phosphoheptulonate synthase [Dehalococcoidia bacterium]|tara:strand:- start:2579 stop:3637 length:1059 start_codon:yes stop_codon:yes gene_type:complete
MKQSISDVNIKRMRPLFSPDDLHEKLPASDDAIATVKKGRDSIKNILSGTDDRLLVIVGPCSIHDELAAMEYSDRLAKLASKLSERILIVMRVYFEKPRTIVGWKGLVYDPHLDGSFDMDTGLSKARRLLLHMAEIGLPAATEFLDPIVPQYLADLVSWVAIGARTTESQTHRQLASGLSMPVGFKNGTDGNSQIAMDAMLSARSSHGFLGIDSQGRTCIVETGGNPFGHLVLRGGTKGTNYEAKTVENVQEQLRKVGLPPQLMVDCSHANSEKDHTRQSIALRDVVKQRSNGNSEIAGVMIESNLFAGKQSLRDDPSRLEYGVSITDACIGWDETESLLTESFSSLKPSKL